MKTREQAKLKKRICAGLGCFWYTMGSISQHSMPEEPVLNDCQKSTIEMVSIIMPGRLRNTSDSLRGEAKRPGWNGTMNSPGKPERITNVLVISSTGCDRWWFALIPSTWFWKARTQKSKRCS